MFLVNIKDEMLSEMLFLMHMGCGGYTIFGKVAVGSKNLGRSIKM